MNYVQVDYELWINIYMNVLHGVSICDITSPFNNNFDK